MRFFHNQISQEKEAPIFRHIHPLNVTYLREKLPHRLLCDPFGHILEITVKPISDNPASWCVIGTRYKDEYVDAYNTYVIRWNGDVFVMNRDMETVPGYIEEDIFYMTLNSVWLGGWIHTDRQKTIAIMKEIGMSPNNYRGPSPQLVRIIEQTRDTYTSTVQK